MKCPYCLDSFHPSFKNAYIESHPANWELKEAICPSCHQQILFLDEFEILVGPAGGRARRSMGEDRMIRPQHTARSPLSPDVLKEYSDDYLEACAVLDTSPKASAALSRRCLQNILRNKAGIESKNLYEEIEQVIPKLPSTLGQSLNYVRIVGNFAAHPIKSTSTNEIIDVEPGEAEWSLSVLEELFDYYFTKPAIQERKLADLEKKLAESRKSNS